MKRITFLILALAVTALPLYANHDDKEGEHDMCGKMMGKEMMMKMMTQKSVTATSDGGVVIVAGEKITKYDKDLNVVKEIEAKMDMESMMKKMDGMMGKCSMMKGKKMDGMAAAETPTGETVVSTTETAVSAEDHAAHH